MSCTLMLLILQHGVVLGQDRFLCAMGSSLDDARDMLLDFPMIRMDERGMLLKASTEGFSAQYQFDQEGGLQSLCLDRKFHTRRLAETSLEVHMLLVERNGATMLRIASDRHQKTYFGLSATTAYELKVSWGKGEEPCFKLSAWSRASDGMDAQIPAIAAAQPDDDADSQ